MTRKLEVLGTKRMREKHVRELMVSALALTKPPHHPHLQNTSKFQLHFITSFHRWPIWIHLSIWDIPKLIPKFLNLNPGSYPKVPFLAWLDPTPTFHRRMSLILRYRFVLPFLSFSIFVPRCICKSHPRWLRVLPSLSPRGPIWCTAQWTIVCSEAKSSWDTNATKRSPLKELVLIIVFLCHWRSWFWEMRECVLRFSDELNSSFVKVLQNIKSLIERTVYNFDLK